MPSLKQFQIGDNVRLTSFAGVSPVYRQRLLAMGLTPGITIHIVRKAPLGCPVQVSLRNTTISLRLDEVDELEWEIVE